MSRSGDVLNRLELVAKKLGMSIEEAVSILENAHPHHRVIPKETSEAIVEKENLEAATASEAALENAMSPEPKKPGNNRKSKREQEEEDNDE